jgi:hypothetical protein
VNYTDPTYKFGLNQFQYAVHYCLNVYQKDKKQLVEFQTGNSGRLRQNELTFDKPWFSRAMVPESPLAFVLL